MKVLVLFLCLVITSQATLQETTRNYKKLQDGPFKSHPTPDKTPYLCSGQTTSLLVYFRLAE